MLYPGFPNFYVLLGHNVAPGHTSVVINIETQARYIAQIVEAQLKNKVRVLEAKQEPTDRYMALV
jgi:cation diffusion facilitator CzcD-associated flavoprotein CzcO